MYNIVLSTDYHSHLNSHTLAFYFDECIHFHVISFSCKVDLNLTGTINNTLLKPDVWTQWHREFLEAAGKKR